MEKKYIVRLTDENRHECLEVVKTLRGSSRKFRHAPILLQSDVAGPAWIDKGIADANRCRTQTVEQLRQRLVARGVRETLDGKKRSQPPTPKCLDGEQEAKIIATRLSSPPKGHANWSLRLLARKKVELEIVGQVSPATLCRMLKKTA